METATIANDGTFFERLSAEELLGVKTVLGAYRSIRGNRRQSIGYISMPLTSGRRLNNLLVLNNVKTLAQLTHKIGGEAIYAEIIRPNIDDGIAFADQRAALDNLLYIAPSVFEAKKWRWSQAAYMALWYQVIPELCGRHSLSEEWQFSIGCNLEAYFSLLLQHGGIKYYNLQDARALFELDLLRGLPMQAVMAELENLRLITMHDKAGQTIAWPYVAEKIISAIAELQECNLPFKHLLGIVIGLLNLPLLYSGFQQIDRTVMEEPEFIDGLIDGRQDKIGKLAAARLRSAVSELKRRVKTGCADDEL